MRFLGLFAVFATMGIGLVVGCSQSNAHPDISQDCRDNPALVPFCLPVQEPVSVTGGDTSTDSPVSKPDTSTGADTSTGPDTSTDAPTDSPSDTSPPPDASAG